MDEYFTLELQFRTHMSKIKANSHKILWPSSVQELRNYMLIETSLQSSGMTINLDGIENSIAKSMTTSVTINKQELRSGKGGQS